MVLSPFHKQLYCKNFVEACSQTSGRGGYRYCTQFGNSVYTSSLTNLLKFLKVITSVSLLLLPFPSRNNVTESGENPGEGHVQS